MSGCRSRFNPHFSHSMVPAPVQEADRAGAARGAMWGIGQARRRTLSASSTGPPGCLSAGISNAGRLNRMPQYAFRRPPPYLPRRKSNASTMECEKWGLSRISPASCGVRHIEWEKCGLIAGRRRIEEEWDGRRRLARRRTLRLGRLLLNEVAPPLGLPSFTLAIRTHVRITAVIILRRGAPDHTGGFVLGILLCPACGVPAA